MFGHRHKELPIVLFEDDGGARARRWAEESSDGSVDDRSDISVEDGNPCFLAFSLGTIGRGYAHLCTHC